MWTVVSGLISKSIYFKDFFLYPTSNFFYLLSSLNGAKLVSSKILDFFFGEVLSKFLGP